MKKIKLFWKIIFATYILLVQNIFSANYYIANSGADANDGSKEFPWKTLMHALKNSNPGDTLQLFPGMFIEKEIWIRGIKGMGGKEGKIKTIMNYQNKEVTLNSERGIIVDASYIRIRGIRFVGAGIKVVNWGGMVTNVELLDNYFIGDFTYGAISFEGNNGLIEGNRIEIIDQRNTRDHGIYLLSGANNIIRGNFISGPVGYGIHIFDEKKTSDPPGYIPSHKNIIIEKNFITASRERSGIILSTGGIIDGVIIRKNVICKNNFDGIKIKANKAEIIKNIQIYNNTIFGNRQGIRISGCSNVIIKNNIIDCSEDYCRVNCHWEDPCLVFVGENVNNLSIERNLYYPKSVGFKGINVLNPFFANPLFKDTAKNDFHLTAESPAIDAGVDMGIPYIGSAPDLGAFEFNSDESNIGESPTKEKNFQLLQNYPNPFNSKTYIIYKISKRSFVNIKIIDITGREVNTLLSREMGQGFHSLTWDGTGYIGTFVPSGIYLCQFEIKNEKSITTFHDTKKMIFLR